jgi:hypothetical protein
VVRAFPPLPPFLCVAKVLGFVPISVIPVFISGKVLPMEKKIFWLLFIVLGLVMDFALPIWWSLALTLPLLLLCWWIAYKSGWFQ